MTVETETTDGTPTEKLREEAIGLLKMNYQNLHQSCWDSHRFSWQMTAIFVPAAGGGVAFLLRLPPGEAFLVWLGGTLVLTVVWFWFGVISVFTRYNSARMKRLKELEKSLSGIMEKQAASYDSGFEQYTLDYSFKDIVEHWRPENRENQSEGLLDKFCKPVQGVFMRLGFHDLTLLFTLVVSVIVVLVCLGKTGT